MRTLSRRNFGFLVAIAITAVVHHSTLFAQAAGQTARAGTLPERLSDAEFWKLMGDISEPGGFFRMADNFVSNEREIGTIAGMITATGPQGGVYMGVGPEQNLTYIAAVKPKMVFIVDIRRQAVMHHLLYKAVFELSNDRADFISLLFARPRPPGIDSSMSIAAIWEKMLLVPMDTAVAGANLIRFRDHLTKTHGFALTPEELEMFDHVQRSFVTYGPGITTNGPSRGGRVVMAGSQASADSAIIASLRTLQLYAAMRVGPVMMTGTSNFVSLTAVTDTAGKYNSFLGSEESFRFLKDLHTRNLFVPNSGNFGGPKAIRAVGEYAKERGATISAFYVSNVEQYLHTDGIADEFYANVATLPLDDKSVFIRPGGQRFGFALCPMAALVQAAAAGRVTNNNLTNQCVR